MDFGETVLAHLPEVGKGSGIPHRSWQTDGNLACGWQRATSRTSTLSERTMELRMREMYRREQLFIGEPQVSHRDPAEAEVDDNR